MEKCLTYNILDVDYLKEKGNGLSRIVKEWLSENRVDALVYEFILDDNASFIVDYTFDEKNNKDKVEKLTENILNRFNIPFELKV
ncbi:MAG: hypothetical protein HFJ13_11530 [Clostridium sp.]|jgi:hypothetical protein|uniref:hypothetical protein n=1 Tax=Clostridium sp. TaxID=1506 RepID=UPI0025BDB1C1|nr:hypothetical protein [Clostridium sp.]MCI9069873.1 hypothetical protein [Clostridium sp.]MCI9304722.1 hypothetical protein [Clostridium sp.]